MNSVEDIDPSCLGHAGLVYEYVLVSGGLQIGPLCVTVDEHRVRFADIDL